jgi:putative ABC transport system permease protein
MLTWRLAWRDLRGLSGGFRLLAAALVLAVAAMAALGSIADGLLDEARAGARQAIGGDLSFRLFHRQPTAGERAFLATLGELSEVAERRARAARPDGAAAVLVELKAIDAAYPLHGSLVLDPPLALPEALARDASGRWGAVVDAELLASLGLGLGDQLRRGAAEVPLRARRVHEPDRALRGFALGPRVLVALPTLAASGLAEPGAAIYWYSRLRLMPGLDGQAAVAAVEARFPHAGWRIVDAADGIPGIERSIELGRALVLCVALAILVIGGVGIAGAVTAHLDEKTRTIAILKSLGATGRQSTAIYLVQLLVVASGATLLGIGLGAALARLPQLAGLTWALDDAGAAVVQPRALALAAATGLATSLLFALRPLDRAAGASPARLLRARVAGPEPASAPAGRRRAVPWALVAALASALALAGLVILASELPVASAAVLGVLLGTASLLAAWAKLVMAGLRWMRPRLGRAPLLRLALANLAGPGSLAPGTITAVGLGLAALVAVLSLEALATRHVASTLPATAPDLVLIDLDPADGSTLERLAAADRAIERLSVAPFLHGRVTHIAGLPVRDAAIPRDMAWVVRGDRGLSWPWAPGAGAAAAVAGEGWRASLAADVARRLGLAPGDRLTLDLQGEAVELAIAGLHEVDWTRLDLDFPILLERPAAPPPHHLVAAIWLVAGQSAMPVVETLGRAFPDAPVILVPEVLEGIARLVEGMGGALRLLAAATLAAAALVLAGGIAAGYRRRAEAASILLSQGARRRQLAMAAALELGVIGLAAALPAAPLGWLAALLVASALAPALWHLDLWVPLVSALLTVSALVVIGAALPPRRPRWRRLLD